MPESIDLNSLSEIDFIKKMSASVQRHISNLDNTLAMMRSGHFIDAFQRMQGSKEGLGFIRQALEERMISRGSKNETNTDKQL